MSYSSTVNESTTGDTGEVAHVSWAEIGKGFLFCTCELAQSDTKLKEYVSDSEQILQDVIVFISSYFFMVVAACLSQVYIKKWTFNRHGTKIKVK